MKQARRKGRWRIWVVIALSVFAVSCFGFWLMIYFYWSLPGDYESIGKRDLEKLEQFCQKTFPTSAELPIAAARRNEEILCEGLGFDASFGVVEYMLQVSPTVKMYVTGPEMTRMRDENYLYNPDPQKVWIIPLGERDQRLDKFTP